MEDKKINKLLTCLFVLSIFSIYIGLYIWSSFTKDVNPHFVLEKAYLVTFAIPIPLLSLILGIIYKNKGYNTNKNIIIGIIISILLLIGTISSIFMYKFHIPIENINEYEDIINIELPTSGTYKKIKWDTPEGYISNYIEFDNEKEINTFYKSIKKDSNWIKSSNLNTELSDFTNPMISSLVCNSKECYYLFYNEEEKTYNKLPTKQGEYNMTLMMYDPDINTLQIEEIIYNYKK